MDFFNSIDVKDILYWILKLVLLCILYIILRYLTSKILKKIERKTVSLDIKEIHNNAAISFINSGIKFIINFIFILLLLPMIGIKISSLIALLSAIGLGIGLGLQDMVRDLFSGIKLLFIQPFKVGDVINTHNTSATVKTMTLFYTVLLRKDNTQLYIPNRELSNNMITNIHYHSTKMEEIIIPLDFINDVDEVKSIIKEILKTQHNIIHNKNTYPYSIILDRINSQYLEFIINYWIMSTTNGQKLRGEILEKIHKQFKEKDIRYPKKNS